ncbi:MAG TPA: hypothetical protein VMK82_10245 [Steroidobacteraceae bacterium]|nr:hypothetical protein [Steroidobacteraceae bacterium]
MRVILDDLRFDRIDLRQRQQVETHVATCVQCARAWQAQSALATLPDMPMPADFQEQCREAVVTRPSIATATGGRNQRRILFWGSLAAVAAAAATLVLLSTPPTNTAPAETVQVLQSEASLLVDLAPALQSTAVAPTAQQDTAEAAAIRTGAAARAFTVRVVVPEPGLVEPAGMYAISSDPAAKDALESLRAALVRELRSVPDLAVVEDDPAQVAAPSRHYQVKIGPLLMMGVDGKPMRKANQYDIRLIVQEVQSDGKTIDRRVPIAGVSVDPLATCISPEAAERMACDTPTTAVFLVR